MDAYLIIIILIVMLCLLIPKLAEYSIYLKIHFIFEDMEKIGLFDDYVGKPIVSNYRSEILHNYGIFRWLYNKGNKNYKNNILYKKADGSPEKYVYLLLQYSYSSLRSNKEYDIFAYCEKRMVNESTDIERKIMFGSLDKIVVQFPHLVITSDFSSFLSSYICTIFPNDCTVSLKRMKSHIESWKKGIDSSEANAFFDNYEKEIENEFVKLFR